MSGDGDHTERESRETLPASEAVFKPSRWPGLIWAVPVAAIGIVGWLGISAFVHSGPSVTVVFPIAGGLKPSSTKVEYKGFDVGEVESVSLSKSLDHIVVRLDMVARMEGHLGPGTQFWIAGNTLSLSNLASIKAVVSGPYIGIDPKPGKTVHHAQGLGAPPVLTNEPKGETLRLVAKDLSNIAPGSPVYFKGYKVGEVGAVELQPDGKQFTIHTFIARKWQNLISSNTRFWNAGAVRIAADGSGPGLHIQSIPALFMGAIAFETPPEPGGHAVQNGAQFILYSSQGMATAAPGPGAVPYRVVFNGGPHGLQPGTPVQLEGTAAGAVTKVAMQYDPAQGTLQTVVDLVLQPERVAVAGPPWNLKNPAPQMNAMLSTLVAHGLRAELGSPVPVIGGKIIMLTMVKGQPAATLQPGDPPQIPSFGSGGGADQVLAQVNGVLSTINAMPLDQIAADIHQATSRLAALSQSRQTTQTLQRLDRAVAHVDTMTRQTNAELPAILRQVKESATEAQLALSQAKGMLSAQGPANAAPETTDLPHALYELTQAARSLRALADFLDSHPGALIAGRGS
jgi:paraquat-inducible protein B